MVSGWANARIQLCGRFVVDVDGARVEDALPGRRGRLLFAYLVLHRGRQLPRDELLVAGWGEDAPAEAGNALSVLLSKLRHGLGADHLHGRTEVELLLPPATFVDVEAARRPGARPGSPTTSPPGRSWPDWTRPGPTPGAAAWRRSASAGWSASPPPAWASAARPWRRPRNAPGC